MVKGLASVPMATLGALAEHTRAAAAELREAVAALPPSPAPRDGPGDDPRADGPPGDDPRADGPPGEEDGLEALLRDHQRAHAAQVRL
eukprot:544316-Prorocentrum_minimum.AAC.1